MTRTPRIALWIDGQFGYVRKHTVIINKNAKNSSYAFMHLKELWISPIYVPLVIFDSHVHLRDKNK